MNDVGTEDGMKLRCQRCGAVVMALLRDNPLGELPAVWVCKECKRISDEIENPVVGNTRAAIAGELMP